VGGSLHVKQVLGWTVWGERGGGGLTFTYKLEYLCKNINSEKLNKISTRKYGKIFLFLQDEQELTVYRMEHYF
jgi:hypothetical protein